MSEIIGVTDIQLAYFAGLFDGEGTLVVGKYPNKGNRLLGYRGFMAIANTHVPVLQYVKAVMGGKIVEQKAYRPLQKAECYSLTFSTNTIRQWLPQLLPFLIVKHDQAKVLLSFLERQAQNAFAPISDESIDFYEECYQKLKKLKQVRFQFKEQIISLGLRPCYQCGKRFEVSSKSPKKIHCSAECKKKTHWTRSNAKIRERKLMIRDGLSK